MRSAYRYDFAADVPMEAVKDALMLATAAVEGLHGRSRIHLDASYRLNEKDLFCEIDAGNEIGCAIARIFTGLLASDIGENKVPGPSGRMEGEKSGVNSE